MLLLWSFHWRCVSPELMWWVGWGRVQHRFDDFLHALHMWSEWAGEVDTKWLCYLANIKYIGCTYRQIFCQLRFPDIGCPYEIWRGVHLGRQFSTSAMLAYISLIYPPKCVPAGTVCADFSGIPTMTEEWHALRIFILDLRQTGGCASNQMD